MPSLVAVMLSVLLATNQLATVEKKRSAFDQLSSIEKNFAVLRDR